MEALIRTHSIDEAVAYVEAFLHGKNAMKLWVVGPGGCGKTFLARWAADQTRNGKRGAIHDNSDPDPDAPFWLAFSRQVPDDLLGGELVEIGVPEYERKLGVLREWAAARGLDIAPRAMDALLTLETDNLQFLRSIADRSAREGILTSPRIQEVDVLRTLGRLGMLRAPEQPTLPVEGMGH